ncbi:MAG: helix-hairpin-helix domain-containing protein [Methanotrichaceae archaeon]
MSADTAAREVLDLPVDPNTASFEELIRVPGIGPKSARRITTSRKSSLRSDLLGVHNVIHYIQQEEKRRSTRRAS